MKSQLTTLCQGNQGSCYSSIDSTYFLCHHSLLCLKWFDSDMHVLDLELVPPKTHTHTHTKKKKEMRQRGDTCVDCFIETEGEVENGGMLPSVYNWHWQPFAQRI